MAITYAEFLETYTKIEQAAIKVVECFKLPAHIVDKVVMFGTNRVEVWLYDDKRVLCGKYIFTIDNKTLQLKQLISQEIFK